MTTKIDLTLTVRDGDGNVLRSIEWIPPMESEMGWVCSCGARTQDQYEDDPGPCGWCQHTKQDATLRQKEVIRCSRCDEAYELQYMLDTHILECES